MKRNKSWFLLMIMLLTIVLIGCYGGDVDDNQNTDRKSTDVAQEMTLVSGGEIATMDSLGGYDVTSSTAMNAVFEGLHIIGPGDEILPGIAKSYEISDDQLTYTFKLREDAVWSNDDPVTAHDFVYAWQKAIHPDTAGVFSYLMLDIKNAYKIQTEGDALYGKSEELGVTALDDHTLQVVLEYQVPYFHGLVVAPVFYPLNKEFVEAQGENYALDINSMLYNGAFIMDSWKQGEGWSFKKNEKYWDADNVKMEKVTVKIVKEAGTSLNLYEAGEIDTVTISSENIDLYKDSAEFSTSEKPTIYFMRYNHTNEFLKNENVRKAIDMGWNKQDMVDVILKNGSVSAHYLVPAGFAKDQNGKDFRDYNGNFNEFNKEEALALWNKGKEELGIEKATVEILSYDSGSSKTIVEYMKNQLETNLPGLTISINMQPSKQKLALSASMDFDMDFGGWAPDYQDAFTFLEIFTTDSYYNQSAYSDPKFDELIAKSRVTADATERWNILLEAEKILMEKATIGPIYQVGSARITKPNLKGLTEHSFSIDMSYRWAYKE